MIILDNLVQVFFGILLIFLDICAIIFLITIAFALIQGTIDNFKNRKIKDEALKSLNETFDKMIEDLQKQKEEEKKPKRKPRTKKVDKKEE